eukprot:g405.t1
METLPLHQPLSAKSNVASTKVRKCALILFNMQQDHFAQVMFSGPPVPDDFIVRVAKLLHIDFDLRIWTKTLHPLNHASIGQNNPGCATNGYEHIAGKGEAIVWQKHCMEGTPGSKWSKDFSPAPDDYIFHTSCGILSPTPDTPTDKLSNCLQENDIDDVYCVGFALDHFIKKGVLKIRQELPHLEIHIVLDIAKQLQPTAVHTATLESQLRWTFLKACQSDALLSQFSNRVRQRRLVEHANIIFNNTNIKSTINERRANIFDLLWHRKEGRLLKLPKLKVLNDIGLFSNKIVNSIDKRCGKSIFHAACEFGDIEIVKMLLGVDNENQTINIQPSVIKVKLKSASNLPNADLFGTSDPYAILMLGESDSQFDWVGTKVHAHQSARVDNQLNPVWDETFLLTASGLKQPMLKINVLDHDVYGADDLLGEVYIKIDQPISLTQSYPLQSSNGISSITLGWQTVYGAMSGEHDDIYDSDAKVQDAKHTSHATKNKDKISNARLGCVDCTLMTTQGHTPITLAAQNGCHDILLCILKSSHANGADLEHCVDGDGGRTALMYAAINGDVRMVKFLLMFGANPHTKSHHGQTALHCACYSENSRSIEVIKCLLNAEPDHEHRLTYLGELDDQGWNAWHMMARSKLLGMIDWRFILGNFNLSAHVNSTTKSGLTILHLAAWNSAYDSIRLLLEGRGPNKKRLFPVIHSNFLTPNNYSELDLSIMQYLNNSSGENDTLQCCIALVSNGYYAAKMSGEPCEKLLYRLILDCHLPGVHGILRYDENCIKLTTELIKTIEHVRYASKCTFTFTSSAKGCSQIMYYSKTRKSNICMVCRDFCCKPNHEKEDLIDIGMLDNQICQCHLTGTCKSIGIKGDTQLQKLTYVPDPIYIKPNEINKLKRNRSDLIAILAEASHKNTQVELEAHGWNYGVEHDAIKMTDPSVIDYQALRDELKEAYIEQAAYMLALIRTIGYNIVGPLSPEQLESRRSSKFTQFDSYGNLELPQELSPIILCIAKEQHEIQMHEKYISGYRYAPMWMINSRHEDQLDEKMVPFHHLDDMSKKDALINAAVFIDCLLKKGFVMVATDKDAMLKITKQKQMETELNIKRAALHCSVRDTTRQRLLNVCLRNAARSNRIPVIKYLLSNTNAAKNSTDKYKYTPLMYAVKRGNVDVVRILLNAGSDCETKTKHGLTPLILASYLGHVELVLLLIEWGVNILAIDNNGMTALHHAVYRNKIAVVDVLSDQVCKKGYSIDLLGIKDFSQEQNSMKLKKSTKLKLDKGMKKLSAKEAFLQNSKAGKQRHIDQHENMYSNYHYFHRKEDPNTVSKDEVSNFMKLIKNTKQIKSKSKYSPLSVAVRQGHSTVVHILLKYGANPISIDSSGKTPYECALEKAGTDFEKLKTKDRGVEKYYTLNSYLYQFWMLLSTSQFNPLAFICSVCVWKRNTDSHARRGKMQRRAAIVRGKSYNTYSRATENASISLNRRRSNEHRILQGRFEQSSKIMDILNTNVSVVALRRRFAMKTVLPRFILLFLAIIFLILGTNYGQLGTGLDTTINSMKFELEKCFNGRDYYNSSIVNSNNIYRSPWWLWHKDIFFNNGKNVVEFPHSCRANHLFVNTSHIHIVGAIRMRLTAKSAGKQISVENESPTTLNAIENLSAKQYIVLSTKSISTSQLVINYLEDNSVLTKDIRSITTTINIFNLYTELYSQIELAISVYKTGKLNVKVTVTPFRLNFKAASNVDLHYPSVGFAIATLIFMSLYIGSKSPVPVLEFFSNPRTALNSLWTSSSGSLVVILALTFIILIVNTLACAIANGIKMKLHADSFIKFDDIMWYISSLHKLISTLLFIVLMEMIHDVLMKFPICGKWVKLFFRNIFDLVLVIPYILIFLSYLLVLGTYFWISTSGNINIFSSTLVYSAKSLIFVPFAEEFNRLNGGNIIIQSVILLTIFILNKNLIGLIGDRWKEQLESASKEWERMLDSDLRLSYLHMNPITPENDKKRIKERISTHFRSALLLLAEDGIHHFGNDTNTENNILQAMRTVAEAQKKMGKDVTSCIEETMHIFETCKEATKEFEALLKASKTNLVRTRLRSAKKRIGQLKFTFNAYNYTTDVNAKDQGKRRKVFIPPPKSKIPPHAT